MVVFGQAKVVDSFVDLVNMIFLVNLAINEAVEMDSLVEEY